MLYGLSTVAGTGMPRVRAYSISSGRVMPQSRAGAITVSVGLSARVVDVEADLVVALAGAAVRDGRRLLDLGDLDELLRDERAAERRRQRVAVLVERVGLQRRQDVVARELLAHVEHVRADGAGRQRAVADVLELLALSEVHRDGDDLGAVLLREPGDGDRRVEPAGVRQHDPFHHAAPRSLSIG